MVFKMRDRLNLDKYNRINIYRYLLLVAVIFFFVITVAMGIAPPTTGPPGGMGG